MYNQPPQLPYNPQAPQWAFLNLNMQSAPPYVPQWNGEPQLMNLVPVVANALAIEIQQAAGRNPLRMFMFNQHAENGFANAVFAESVQKTMDYIWVQVAKNQISGPDQAIGMSVPQMAEMLCAYNLRLFPGLDLYLGNTNPDAVRNTIATYDAIMNEVRMLRQQAMGHQQNTWNPGGGQGNAFSGNSWGLSNNQGRAGYSGSTNTGASSSFFSNSSAASSGNRPVVAAGKYGNNSTTTTNFSNNFQPTPTPEPPVNTTAINDPATPDYFTEYPASEGKVKWRPSIQYPYLPAYAPSTQEMFFKYQPDGSVEFIVRLKDKNAMDYARHSTKCFGPIPKTFDITNASETMLNIEKGIQEMNKVVNEVDEDGKPVAEVKPFVYNGTFLDTCETSAWLIGARQRLIDSKDGELPMIYRFHSFIADPIISLVDEIDAVKNFANSSTFIELREKINVAVKDASPELWGTANRRMTDTINRVLKQNLSLPGVTIDSYIDDISDLIEYIGNKFGDTIQKEFLEHQAELIQGTFQNLGSNAEDLTTAFLEDHDFPEGVEPKITYIASHYSMTYLNCVSYELDLELAKDTASAVLPTLHPMLHQLIDSLFTDIDKKSDKYLRHLIRTNDGRVLEVTRGYIGKDFYLITLLK